MLRPRPDHIIWDWNGTLLDDVDACVGAINRLLEVRDLPLLSTERYRDIFTFPVKRYYTDLGFDFETEDWDALAREFHARYAETSAASPLREHVRPFLDAMRERRVPMSVLSASEEQLLQRMMGERQVSAYFEQAIGLSDLYAHSKLEAGQALMRQLGLPGQRILFVGDTDHDRNLKFRGYRLKLLLRSN